MPRQRTKFTPMSTNFVLLVHALEIAFFRMQRLLWADAATLTRTVTLGILDVPQFRNNQCAQGMIQTSIMEGHVGPWVNREDPFRKESAYHLSSRSAPMTSYLHTELKAEIELTRERFHRFLATIPEDDLKLPSKDPDWSNGELLYRMSIASLIIPSTLKKNKTDKSKTSAIHAVVTGPLIQRTNELFIRARAANSTRWSIAKEYADSCARVLEMLEGIPVDGFERKLMIFEEDPLLPKPATVEQLFHYVKNHFDVYRKQINPGK